MTKQFPPLIYVAGAYAGDVSANIQKAEEVSISLIRNGWHVITPHKKTWITMDLNILERCDALYVMDNWRTSTGTQEEINFAAAHDIPEFFEEVFPSTDFLPGKLAEYYSIYGV